MGGLIEINGCLMATEGDRVVAHMIKDGGFEVASLDWWGSLDVAGRTVLDIGCYTGIYSIIAAKRGAKVYAFEPMPQNRMRAAMNFARNGVYVSMMECAVSDRVGQATLDYNPNVALTSGASLVSRMPGHKRMVVKTITIDHMALQGVAAMKIDVERAEPAVIRGAMETIRRDRPALLIETLDAPMRFQIGHMLPDYKVEAIFDDRNTLYLPNT